MKNYNLETKIIMSLFLLFIMFFSFSCTLIPSLNNPQKENQKTTIPTKVILPSPEAQSSNKPNREFIAADTMDWKNNWLHFGVDNQFSSFNPNETLIDKKNVANLEPVGGISCNDGLFSIYGGTPAFFHGRMIITHAGGWLESANPKFDNEMFWQFGEPALGWAPPPVITNDGIVYYLYVTNDASSKLFAVDAESGKQIWESSTQFKTGFNNNAQVTVDEKNGQIYVIEDIFGDGRLYALDLKTGEISWFLGDKSEDKADPTFLGNVILLKDDKLYIPAAIQMDYYKREGMVRVDPLTQKIDMHYELPSMKDTAKYVGYYGLCNSHIFASYIEGSRLDPAKQFVAHSIDKPEIVWEKEISGQSGRLACDPRKNIIYIPTLESLIALDADTGSVIWEHKSIKSVFTPTIANDIIYYISDTNMYALDQENGKQLFRYPLGTGSDPSTGVAVNDGMVAFSGSGGKCDLYILGFK